MSRSSVVGLLCALVCLGAGQSVVAQGQRLVVGGSASAFGRRELAPGFVPDPVRVAIRSGGSIDAGVLRVGSGCSGWVTSEPSFILMMTGNSASLKVKFEVPGAVAAGPLDTTLIVNTARGAYRCNDDANGTPNPEVNLAGQGAGQYDIWVGSFRQGAVAAGTLLITEL